LFEKGWISESGKLYCPECWAIILTEKGEKIRKFEEELKGWSVEAKCKQDQIRVQIEEMRQQLELYSSGKMLLQEEFATTSIALAQYGIGVLNHAFSMVKDDNFQSLKENFERNIKPVVRSILGTLDRIKFQDILANVNDLIHLCFQLTKVNDLLCMVYYLDDIKFPVDILVHLGEVKCATVLEKLCQIVCDSNVEPRIKNVFIIALGRIGDKRSVDTLLNVLKEGSNDWGIINSATCALADLGDERAVMSIIGAIERYIYTGDFHDWTARNYIAERLGKMVRPGTDLYQEICNKWRQLKKIYGITELDVTISHALLPVLEKVLVDCGNHEALEIATEWARSGQNDIALKGTKALASLDYEEALDMLCSILVTPREVYDEGDFWDKSYHYLNNEQRILAAKALAQKGGSKAIAVLQEAASDREANVREVIGQLLSNL
jgi:hypothetical protein